jgi:hypothetical protein
MENDFEKAVQKNVPDPKILANDAILEIDVYQWLKIITAPEC